MKKLLALAGLAMLVPSIAEAFTAEGRFLYEDRLWDKAGYTGEVQNLPIRHARVDIVNVTTQQVLASGATDESGNFSFEITGQLVPLNIYARCLTDGRPAAYEIRVVDELVRGLTDPAVIGNIHAITTDPVLAHDPVNDLNFGIYLIEDNDGTGVAQAFNIFDNAVDYFDWMAQPSLNNGLPTAAEYIVYAWSPTASNEGSNYSGHAILLSSPGQGNDTDGWSDTVILHETGHWFDDTFSRSDNPGGAHSLGDNNQNPKLSYGEGVATFHCSKVREHRATTRLNLSGLPVDDHVSIYGDLMIPPDPPNAGALSFAYDFETGVAFQPGLPPAGFVLGQRGTANETNITSAQWDLVDGPNSPDETPGVDDDGIEVADSLPWAIERTYLPSVPAENPITVEDYYQGWFALNGPTFMKTQVDQVFIDLALMEFEADAFEPDNTVALASSITTEAYSVSPTAHVVINELDLGAQDAVELYNASDAPVDLTGWEIQAYVNNDAAPVVSRIYVVPPFTLNPGEAVAVFERGDPLNNGDYHLYAGTTPNAFNMSWNTGIDGAVVVRDPGGQAVDFVRWRDANGVDNTTPTPAGTGFSGILDSSPAGQGLARDISGTDTDQASDFSARPITLASVNFSTFQHHTLFGTNDEDVIAFQAVAGQRYGFEARGFFSASDPYLEILSPAGVLLGANDNSDVGVTDARLDFFAGVTDTYFLRVRHVGAFTDWAAYNIVGFQRPASSAFLPPSAMTANAENASNTGDVVHLQWLNSAAYDSVRVYRDGAVIATLAGSPSTYDDMVDRGVYEWEVSGFLDGLESSRASTVEYAGLITCTAQDDFETGNADQWEREDLTWDVTPFAEDGLWGFTDSPAGTYSGCPAGESGCAVNRTATFRVPAILPASSQLTFDQICITEHCEPVPCDVCIVEISTDDGSSWTELARYDQASDPAWGDNVADPTDWRPVDLDLSAYAGQTALIRLRLQSDALLELDGWYVDNLKVNDNTCSVADAGDVSTRPARLDFLPPVPNPMRSSSRMGFVLPEARSQVSVVLYDVSGRIVRQVELGPHAAGSHGWVWDGNNSSGAEVTSGVYFARLVTERESLTRKVLKLTE